MRGATCDALMILLEEGFQSTRPMRGATLGVWIENCDWIVSIHAPHAGRDCDMDAYGESRGVSIHAPHAGRDPVIIDVVHDYQVSIHAPHAGRDDGGDAQAPDQSVSIHAPHAGRDESALNRFARGFLFQSTRPMRGATQRVRACNILVTFQSTRPMRGATVILQFKMHNG